MPSIKRKRIPEYKGTGRKFVKKMKTVAVPRSRFSFMPSANLNIFPRKIRQTVVYSEVFPVTLNAVANLTTWTTWRVNALFDPRFAIGGGQPMGFDQLMAIYMKYTVVGAKVTFAVTGGTNHFNNGWMGINIRDPVSSAVTTTADSITSQYSKSAPWGLHHGTSIVTLNFDGPKYFNATDIVSDDTLAGTSVQDPIRVALADCWVGCDQAPVTPNNIVNVMVKIEYDAFFYEPRNVPPS